MKKIIISLILAFTLIFTCSCDFSELFSGTGIGNTDGVITDGNADRNHGEHEDENNNGKCDICSISVITVFDFYAINDLHGKFIDSESQPGVDELTTYLLDAKKSNKNTIFLSSGDTWQGTAESNLTGGLLLTDWMNELGFASMTLGNHEFDWGEEFIENNKQAAEFPLLAINVFDKDTDERVSYCKASTVLDFDGIQIGIIGAVGDVYSSISSDRVEDIYFKTGDALTELVKEESIKLRSSGVDIIVYSLHDGYDRNKKTETEVSDRELRSYYDIELSEGGYVDLVFEAHTHKYYVLKDSAGIYHLQGGGENENISHVAINYNFANSKFTVGIARTIRNDAYEKKESHELTDTLLDKYADELAKADEVLGTSTRQLSSEEIKEIVSALYYKTGVLEWGDEYDIALGGGYLSVRNPYSLYEGEVTYRELYSLLPFDNQLVLCSISGRDLKNRFFFTNNSDYYITYGEYGAALMNNIDDSATYYIVTDTYSSQYKPNNLTVIESYAPDVFARDLFAEYIKAGGLTN